MDNNNYALENQKIKDFFAKTLGISKKNVQDCVEELVSLSIEKSGLISASDILTKASDVNSYSHGIFDWDGDEGKRLEIANLILEQLSFLIDKDGKIYEVKKK